MASLYRCRARVAYRPSRSNNLIVFEERQIQEVSVKLKWKPSIVESAADRSTPASLATNFLSQSQCQVTISDPYLTGLAWPALFDAAALYNAGDVAAANNINLPACTPTQDPKTDKCFRYPEFVPGSDDQPANWAFLIISLWYDVGGGSFGSDYYFRISSLSISHGTTYPTVTIRGVEARSVLFNQSIINIGFEESLPINEALKKVANDLGYEAEFCVNPTPSPYPELDEEKRLPRSFRFKGVTHSEVMSRLIDHAGGNMLSLPTREYANKISICARGDIDQGCSVFYLGRGLYSAYEINGSVEGSLFPANFEGNTSVNSADPYVSEAPKAKSYELEDVYPNKRKEDMKSVNKLTFPSLFTNCKPKCTTKEYNGIVWKGAGPKITPEELKGFNLRGVAPNGEKAISFLSGSVVEGTDADGGRVTIRTDFYLKVKVADKDTKEQPFNSQIFQESTNVAGIKVKGGERVAISQEIGTSTKEKPEFVRFYIKGNAGEFITLSPELVWKYAISSLTTPPTPRVLPSAPVAAPGQAVAQAPKAPFKNWKAVTNARPNKVGITVGHGDVTVGPTGAEGEKELVVELVRWAQRNATKYGIQDYVEFYIPPSTLNLPDTGGRALDSRYTWGWGQKIVDGGGKAYEIHLDTPTGSSGVIPPCGSYANRIGVLDDELAKSYGAFPANYRECLGGPIRGVTFLEVGRMDPATLSASKSTDAALKERLYSQLMDPLMRAIAAEKNRQGPPPGQSPAQALATTSTATPPIPAKPICFRMGNSGTSTGPHVHVQWTDKKPIDLETVQKYIDVKGTFTSGYGQRNGRLHEGVDIANNIGTPICLKEGVTFFQAVETKCPNNTNRSCGSGGGFGNFVAVKVPGGREMLLAHLSPDSDFSTVGSSSGVGTGNAGSTQLGGAASPGVNGLLVETSFKGVPRALRIIPGRTILSFITDYDSWIENGRKVDGGDPGVWIPGRFKNWMVQQCEYKWMGGDLKVVVEGVSAWGSRTFKVPTFDKYMEGLRADRGKYATSSQYSNNYYDYIRSPGSLSWVTEDGKDSTEVICNQAQELSQFLAGPSDNTSGTPTSPASVTSSFPAAKCSHPNNTYNEVIKAMAAAGLKTKEAYAGVLGNMAKESFTDLDWNVHNTSRASPEGCGRTPSRVLGTFGYGLVQWCGGRADELASKYKCGRNCNLSQQLSFLGYELQRDYKSMMQRMNAAKTAGNAAAIFRSEFERPSAQDEADRRRLAEQIFRQITCSS